MMSPQRVVQNNESIFQKQYCIEITLNYKNTCKYSRKNLFLKQSGSQEIQFGKSSKWILGPDLISNKTLLIDIFIQ